MKMLLLAVLLAGTATPAAAVFRAAPPTKQAPKSAEPKGKAPDAGKKAAGDLDMKQLMQFVDTLFPALPAPPTGRVALARLTANGVLPNGTYAALFDEVMSGMVERVLSIRPGDLDGKKKGKGPQKALRDELAKDDPHFEERLRIARRVIGEELVKISAVVEPRLREGLSLSIARRFDEAQLREINSFLATSSGRAFGSQTMRMWMDPDVMRSMFQTFPDMITAMPSAIKRLEDETRHLPKPRKKAAGQAKDDAENAADEPAEEELEEELPEA